MNIQSSLTHTLGLTKGGTMHVFYQENLKYQMLGAGEARACEVGRRVVLPRKFNGDEHDVQARFLSYHVFMPKSSTHRMHHPGSIVAQMRPKVFTDNQMSQIKYNYYINSVSKDYDDS
jgi:hypothetical protein